MEGGQEIGWIGAIIVGGFAGWLAEKFMKSEMGILMNIVLGVVGAIVLNFLLSLAGISASGGIFMYLIVAFVGASLLIAVARMIRR